MFNHPGTKIKKLATAVFWIEAIGGTIAILASEMLEDMFLVGILAIAGVWGVAYISSLFLAAFGDLVESNRQLQEQFAQKELE